MSKQLEICWTVPIYLGSSASLQMLRDIHFLAPTTSTWITEHALMYINPQDKVGQPSGWLWSSAGSHVYSNEFMYHQSLLFESAVSLWNWNVLELWDVNEVSLSPRSRSVGFICSLLALCSFPSSTFNSLLRLQKGAAAKLKSPRI